jgi:hypothetical protein
MLRFLSLARKDSQKAIQFIYFPSSVQNRQKIGLFRLAALESEALYLQWLQARVET